MFDYLIIGAGIVGASIARVLSKYKLDVLVLEKESDVANYQTIANSAIIHSGHDPEPNTLKSKLCVQGNRMYETLAKELSFPLDFYGGIVLAFSTDEVEQLHQLYNKAKYNAVQNFNLLSREEILKHEPYVNDDVKLGLFLPSTKVTVPWEVCIASVENAIENGVKVRLNSKVTSIRKINSHFEVGINDTEFIQTKNIINACGLFADEIAGLLEKDVKYKINPRKGEYFTLEKSSERMFNHVIYSVPTNSTKGVLITPQVDGHTLIGPTSEDIDDKEDNSVTLRGLKYIIEQSKKLSRYIPFEQNIRNFAGVRAKSTYDDFYIKESLEYKGFYHVAGIDSPGLTAAPAIAEYLLSLIKKNQVLVEKESYNPYRKKNNSFHSLSVEQQTNLYKTNHKYGQIICKCEKVTKKEIIDAISGPLGVDTIKGIKKRTRAGAGICQGGFCEHDILKIIGMIKNKPLQTIDYYEKDTNILYKDLKVKK